MIRRQKTYKFLGVQNSVCRKSHAECAVVENVKCAINCVGSVCRLRWQICNPGESHCAALGFHVFPKMQCVSLWKSFILLLAASQLHVYIKHGVQCTSIQKKGEEEMEWTTRSFVHMTASLALISAVFLFFFSSLFSYEHLWSAAGP